MALTTAATAEIISKFKTKSGRPNTGSSEAQVTLLTQEIELLTKHLQKNKNDKHSGYGLQQKVNARRGLLNYLKRTEAARYAALISNLGLRN